MPTDRLEFHEEGMWSRSPLRSTRWCGVMVPNFVGGYIRRKPDWHFLSVAYVPPIAWDELEYA